MEKTQIQIMFRGEIIDAAVIAQNEAYENGGLVVAYVEPGKSREVYGTLEIEECGKREAISDISDFRARTRKLGVVGCVRGYRAGA